MRINWKTLFAASLPFCFGVTMQAAAGQDYTAGRQLGTCLVQAGTVFTGTIETIGPPQSEPGIAPDKAMSLTTITVRVDEWLYGQRQNADKSVELVRAQKPQLSKTASGPWSVWEGVAVKPGGKLMIARWSREAERPRWGLAGDDVALVRSDTASFDEIRGVVRQQAAFDAGPAGNIDIPAILSQHNSSFFAGYLASYLTEREVRRDVNRAALSLTELLSSGLVPQTGWSEIGDWIGSSFNRLSGEASQAVMVKLFAAASSPTLTVAEPAITALLRFSGTRTLVPPPLDDNARGRLEQNYRVLAQQGKVPPGRESQLSGRDSR